MSFFRDAAIQRAILQSIGLYLLILLLCLLLGNTVLLAIAITAYIVTPLLIGIALARTSSVRRSLEQMFLRMGAWLMGSVVILTLALYVVTDVWNPDKFIYSLGVPPLHMKLLILLGLQGPWILASVLAGFIPLLFRKHQGALAD